MGEWENVQGGDAARQPLNLSTTWADFTRAMPRQDSYAVGVRQSLNT